MIKVAIYCRLSVEDRDKANSLDDSESIQNQKNLLTRYAIEKNWAIFRIYSDDDYSGLDKDRPAFNQMIKDAREGKFNVILCKSQSRFTRDMELVEKYLHNDFLEWGIRFISLTDNADTAEKGNKKSRQINGLVNEWYCEDLSEAIKSSFNTKRELGQFIGSFAAYGYVKSEQDHSMIIVDEEAAKVIRQIFDWYLEGYGTQHIAYMLNEKGIPNPTKYKQSKGLRYINSFQKNDYGLWNKTTVKRILRNELYTGTMVQGVRRKVSYKSKLIKQTPKSEWYIVRNTHTPIIDRKMFDIVQKRIAGRSRSSGEGQVHLFALKLRCMTCGSTMNKSTAFKGYVYLRCKLYTVDPQRKLCSSHSIRLDQLQEIVTDQIRGFINSLCDEKDISIKLKCEEEVNSRINALQAEYERLSREMSEKERMVKNLYIDKLKGVISEEQFMEFNKSFTHEKETVEKRLEQVRNEIRESNDKMSSMEKWADIVRKYKGFTELTRVMVSELIDYIEIGEKDSVTGDQSIKIHWQF